MPASFPLPIATPTVSNRFVPVALTVWFQIRLDMFVADAPLAAGPTASKTTAAGAVATVSEIVAVWVRLPLMPVTVSAYVPAGVLAPVVTVSVDDDVAGFGPNVPDAPLGSPLTLRVTGSANPPPAVMVIP